MVLDEVKLRPCRLGWRADPELLLNREREHKGTRVSNSECWGGSGLSEMAPMVQKGYIRKPYW